jgi:ubiquinone/menaquinone biosynthesis C-methylase UbiE
MGGVIWKSGSARRQRLLARIPIALLLTAGALFGQPSQSRSEEERVAEMKTRVVALLGLKSGDTAADVGCGDGFYTIPLARFLGPSGRVYAEDISDAQLSKLKQHLGEEGLKNVDIIKGAVDDPKLPNEVLDGALIVNAYHEMTDHEAMLGHVISALKPGGVLVLMDGMWNEHEARSREEQVNFHELAPVLANPEVEKAAVSKSSKSAIHLLNELQTAMGNPDGGR